MIQIENTETFGWEAAIRGMRNPMNSWEMSDSEWCFTQYEGCHAFFDCCPRPEENELGEFYCIGEDDYTLALKLAKAGSDHGKFLRMINVFADITAPLYWWKEFDTYKVGTTANSCSTMHKIHDKEFTLEDFSVEHIYDEYLPDGVHLKESFLSCMVNTIATLNYARLKYLETKDKKYWWQMIQLLPSSYNQKRTVQLNYAVLRNMYHSRKNHKLDEWHKFCEWIEQLPYQNLITEQ